MLAPLVLVGPVQAREEANPIRRIPQAQPLIGERERELIEQVLSSGVLALGPFARSFEEGIATLANRRYGVSCSSGTAGLHMAVRALGIGEGEEVITTPFSFVASANCVLFERALPRFVDIEERTLGLDPTLVEDAASASTRAVLPVHVFGRLCQIPEIVEIARRRGWSVIEDACEALGSAFEGTPAGSFGDASVFAFYPNKQITTGEGGVVVTDDPDLAAMFRSLRNQGRDEDETWLRHTQLGYNYRMDELSAALGVAQLERRAELAAARARVAEWYVDALGDADWLELPHIPEGDTVDWFVYVVRLAPTVDRAALMEHLAADGISTRPYFVPLHLQPFYQRSFGYRAGDFPVAERVGASTLALPFSPVLNQEDVAYVADSLIRYMRWR
jgi:perosamine synthetase